MSTNEQNHDNEADREEDINPRKFHIAFKNGTTLGPLPALYTSVNNGGIHKLVDDFNRYLKGRLDTDEHYYDLGTSSLTIDLREVAAVVQYREKYQS